MRLINKFLRDISIQKKWYHKTLYDASLKLRNIRLPLPKFWGAIFYNSQILWIVFWRRVKQFFFYEPMFRYRCTRVGKGLYFESNFPLILGYGSIYVGDRVRISGNANFFVSYKVNPNPTIVVGDDVYLGYGALLSCADRITIGNRVLIANFVAIYDNNNHPIDPGQRAKNMPVEKDDITPVLIEDDVWVGANAIILKGVTIGQGSVVATGSVVTRDVPPMVVVAGNPAKVVQQIKSNL